MNRLQGELNIYTKGRKWMLGNTPPVRIRGCMDCGQRWIDFGDEKQRICWNPDCHSGNTSIELVRGNDR